MDLEWDEAKDAENRRKHGISLADAARLDWDTSPGELDLRRDYGEPRWTMSAMLGGRLHVCIFTLRKGQGHGLSRPARCDTADRRGIRNARGDVERRVVEALRAVLKVAEEKAAEADSGPGMAAE